MGCAGLRSAVCLTTKYLIAGYKRVHFSHTGTVKKKKVNDGNIPSAITLFGFET